MKLAFSICLLVSMLTMVQGQSSSASCVAAYEAMDNDVNGACDTNGATVDQIQTDPCPAECQATYDAVIESCQPGVDVYLGTQSQGLIFEESLLFHEQGPFSFFPHWKSCDYGYEPTECDLAIDALDQSRFNLFGTSPAVCEKDNGENEDQCSPECTALIRAVVEACDKSANAQFAPGGGFLGETFRQIPWESPKAMNFMGYNPNEFDFIGTLTFKCWDVYAKGAAGGGSSSGGATPTMSFAFSSVFMLVATSFGFGYL
jgi:hypothetical protein